MPVPFHRPKFRYLSQLRLSQPTEVRKAIFLLDIVLLQRPFQEGDTVHQRPVIHGDELEVSVPGEKVCERIGPEKNSKSVEGPPLVDIPDPSVENGLTFRQFLPGPEEFSRGLLNLGGGDFDRLSLS